MGVFLFVSKNFWIRFRCFASAILFYRHRNKTSKDFLEPRPSVTSTGNRVFDTGFAGHSSISVSCPPRQGALIEILFSNTKFIIIKVLGVLHCKFHSFQKLLAQGASSKFDSRPC